MLKPRRTATLLALLALALTAPAAHAQGDLKTPYRLRVVLHVARHRLLTDIFRQRLERELGDGLQGALGELGEVQVVSDHPKLAEVLRDGLQRALDTWDERSDVKTHFVLVDYAGAHIEILQGDDPAQTLLEFARSRGITQLFVGHSQRGRLARLRGSPLDRLIWEGHGMDVRVFPQ